MIGYIDDIGSRSSPKYPQLNECNERKAKHNDEVRHYSEEDGVKKDEKCVNIILNPVDWTFNYSWYSSHRFVLQLKLKADDDGVYLPLRCQK